MNAPLSIQNHLGLIVQPPVLTLDRRVKAVGAAQESASSTCLSV